MSVSRYAAPGSVKQLASFPTAQADLTRLAAHRLRFAGIDLEPLLSRAGLTSAQVDDPDARVPAHHHPVRLTWSYGTEMQPSARILFDFCISPQLGVGHHSPGRSGKG